MAAGTPTTEYLHRALQTDEMPDNILPLLWLGMKSIILDNSTLKDDVSKLELRTNAIEEDNQTRDSDVQQLQNSVQFLQAQLTRNEMTQGHLMHDVEDLKRRSMRDNLIFRFDSSVTDFKEKKRRKLCSYLFRHFFARYLASQLIFISNQRIDWAKLSQANPGL